MSFSLLSFANLLKGSVSLLLTKLVAVSFGPPGIVALSALQNVLGVVGPISNLGINSGSVLFIARSKEKELASVMFTLAVMLSAGFIVGSSTVYIIGWYGEATSWFTVEPNMTSLVAFCLASSVSALVAGYLQGRDLFKKFALATIIGSAFNLLILSWAYYHASLEGLVNFAALQLCVYGVVLCVMSQREIRKCFVARAVFQPKIIGPVFKIGGFSLLSGVLLSAGFLAIRADLIEGAGLDITGNWDAAMRIFPLCTLLICMPVFSRYFSQLCRASVATDVVAIYRPIIVFISTIFLLGLIVVFFGSELIVALLFSDSFTFYIETMFFFVLGDVIRTYSTIFNYINLATQNYAEHFVGEVVFIISLVGFISVVDVTSMKFLSFIYLGAALISLFMVMAFVGISMRNLGKEI